MRKIVTGLVGILCITQCALAAPVSGFQDFLDQWRSGNQLASVVVSVEDLNTHKITNYSSGTLILKGKTTPPAATLYGVGSISKTFVAATLLQLQQEKKLSLDDPIGSYFPEYPHWSKVTIRQLLNMTSGIYNFTETDGFKQLKNSSSKNTISAAQMIAMAYQQPEYFFPAKGWHYSNTNYLLAGLIIEKVTHESLAQVYTDRFFKPLHLTHTLYSDTFYPTSVEKYMAHAYQNGVDITNFNAGLVGAAGSMVMNSQDILTWTQALLTPGKILTVDEIKQLQTTIAVPPSPPKPVGSRYGLGIYSLDIPQVGTTWFYTGVIKGYTSVFVWLPTQHKIIVAQAASLMDNTANNNSVSLLFPDQVLIQTLLAQAITGGNVMPIVTIDQSDHEVLKEIAKPVTFPLSQESEQTIADLKTTFTSLASPYGKPAGLAAPQIGVSQRIFIVQVPPEAKQRRQQVFDTVPPTIFINPSYTPVLSAGKYRDWEACYSVPNKMGEVDRYFEVDFSAYTEDGKPVHFTAKGFYARLLQHETDHLNGKDYLDYHCPDCRFGNESVMLKISKAEQEKKQERDKKT